MDSTSEGDIWHDNALSVNEHLFRYKRVLLKLSGEPLMGRHSFGIFPEAVKAIALEIAGAAKDGVQIGIVIGGGNIFRGVAGSQWGMDRVNADNIGMLATVMNALVLKDAIIRQGVGARVLSAIEVGRICEPFTRDRAIRHLEKGEVVIFAAGTGNPFFTTDTAAALRALEIKAECLFKATKVDGVYDRDPVKEPRAKRFKRLTYKEVIEKGLRVMDHAAISLAMDAGLPVVVFSLMVAGNIQRVLKGEDVGTLISAREEEEEFHETPAT